MRGWKLEYVPIILAKGLCPATMPAFFKQQYRWCMGSMSLLVSDKFWNTEMNLRSRLSYISGFLYYVHTALMSIYTPFVPILLLVLMPSEIRFANYFLVLPAFIFTQIIYPLWHKSVYGIEAWATRNVYGWAYLFAIIDHIIDKPMGWQPTGTKIKKDRKYIHFRIMQFLFNFIPAIIWVGFSMYHLAMSKSPEYIPILISGLYYLAVVLKVSFYSSKSLIIRDKPSKRIARSLSVAS
jgi:cellulose synthase (UDP-forming)